MRNGTDAGFTDVDYSIGVEASGEYKDRIKDRGVLISFETLKVKLPFPNHETMIP